MSVEMTWLHKLLIIYKPKLSLNLLFLFAIDIPQYMVGKMMGSHVSAETVQRMFTKLNEACCTYVLNNPILFSGSVDIKMDPNLDDKMPEEPTGVYKIDEMKAKHHRGTSYQLSQRLFGMVERSTGRCFAQVLLNRKKVTLQQIVQSKLSLACHINHDSYASYTFLDDLHYSHSAVNHSREFKAADGTHTNTIEGSWGLLRQRITAMHETKQSYINNVIQEFCFQRFYSTWLNLAKIIGY